jgi:hypothetical protein
MSRTKQTARLSTSPFIFELLQQLETKVITKTQVTSEVTLFKNYFKVLLEHLQKSKTIKIGALDIISDLIISDDVDPVIRFSVRAANKILEALSEMKREYQCTPTFTGRCEYDSDDDDDDDDEQEQQLQDKNNIISELQQQLKDNNNVISALRLQAVTSLQDLNEQDQQLQQDTDKCLG